MNLTKYQREVYLIDIGLWILLLMKLYKIVIGIRQMTKDEQNNKNILITICAGGALFWFFFFVGHTEQYSLKPAVEAIFTVLALSGLGAYIIWKGIYNVINLTRAYSAILILVGLIDGYIDMGLFGNSLFSADVLRSSIICEVFYAIVGTVLLYKMKSK